MAPLSLTVLALQNFVAANLEWRILRQFSKWRATGVVRGGTKWQHVVDRHGGGL